jgi:hypothetical protein
VQGALGSISRKLLLAGGLVAAAWLMTGGGGVLKDEVKRRETVRRVKNKVGRAGDWAWAGTLRGASPTHMGALPAASCAPVC